MTFVALSTTADSVMEILEQTSLAGTSVPGSLTTDAGGNLLIDPDTKAIMDYFLSLNGEMDSAELRQTVIVWARQQAGGTAADEFIALFDQYQTYILALADGEFSASDEQAIRRNLQLRQALRNEIFGAVVASAFFAEEDHYDQFSAQRMALMATNMDEDDKQRAMHALVQTLPEPLAQQYKQQQQLDALRQQEQALKNSGGTDADIYAHRQQQFGDMAALRLQSLDDERRQWQTRLEQYRTARHLIASAALSPTDQQLQIAALREELFSPAEQLRVAALDRIAQQPR